MNKGNDDTPIQEMGKGNSMLATLSKARATPFDHAVM
jgi:hypothetical protein